MPLHCKLSMVCGRIPRPALNHLYRLKKLRSAVDHDRREDFDWSAYEESLEICRRWLNRQSGSAAPPAS